MSSILSMIRAGRFHSSLNRPIVHCPMERQFLDEALHHETMHVLATNIAEEMFSRPISRSDFRTDLEDITPPFSRLWIEAACRIPGGTFKLGVLVRRFPPPAGDELASLINRGGRTLIECPDKYGHYVDFVMFTEYEARVILTAMTVAITDKFGQLVWVGHAIPDSGEHNDTASEMTHRTLFVACEAMVRMNTQGTVLVPEKSLKLRKPKIGMLPACVWHTIHIVGPKYIHGGRDCCTEEAIERREHWVRAHRADYRKGRGLFGHIKELIWVPEHKRGNPELGLVIPQYVVH